MNVRPSNVVTMRQITVNNNAWLFSLVMYERTAMLNETSCDQCLRLVNNCKQHKYVNNNWLFILVIYECMNVRP